MLNPTWRTTPTAAQVAAAYPKKASALKSGFAVVRCAIDANGATRGCDIISESPLRMGFGDAAVALARDFRAAPIEAGAVPFQRADIPFAFPNPAVSQEPALRSPKWIRSLSPAGAAKLFPAPALEAKVLTGLGVVECVASAAGEMSECRQVREEPAGLGFGAAGVEAAKLMVMNPWSNGGEPVAGRRITLPIRFNYEVDASAPPAAP